VSFPLGTGLGRKLIGETCTSYRRFTPVRKAVLLRIPLQAVPGEQPQAGSAR
jgi:hypothetical protein